MCWGWGDGHCLSEKASLPQARSELKSEGERKQVQGWGLWGGKLQEKEECTDPEAGTGRLRLHGQFLELRGSQSG